MRTYVSTIIVVVIIIIIIILLYEHFKLMISSRNEEQGESDGARGDLEQLKQMHTKPSIAGIFSGISLYEVCTLSCNT